MKKFQRHDRVFKPHYDIVAVFLKMYFMAISSFNCAAGDRNRMCKQYAQFEVGLNEQCFYVQPKRFPVTRE